MPDIRADSTIEALARAFTSNGRKQEQAMIDVKYSASYARKYCGQLWANPRLKAAIARIDAKTAKKMDLSREGQHKKLEEALKMAKESKNPAAMTSAIREQNEMLGYHRDKAPNDEKVAEILARMTDEEIEARRIVAKIRTAELAGGPKLSNDKEIA